MSAFAWGIFCLFLFVHVQGGIIGEKYKQLKFHLKKSYVDYVERHANIEEDAILPVPQLVRKYNYTCEEHTVKTPDGYILTLHRIPHGNTDKYNASTKRPVVFLQHGILASSGDWVITGRKKGLAYILAEEGYDVWMGNVRGNRYSRRHIYMNPKNPEFWEFSWHEMGVYDLPTMIDYVLEKTNQRKLSYIGHSQGTTIFFVMCSELPQYNGKITAQFSLAPIAYVENMKSPLLRFLSYFKGPFGELLKLIGLHEFLPQSEFMAKLGDAFCRKDQISQVLCTNALFAICGFNIKQLNTTLLPVILGHTPAGASTKQFIHFAQGIRSGQFRRWDYGIWGNYKHYGSFRPPKYNMKNVRVPVYLFYAANDWLSDEKDVMRLYKQLGDPRASILVSDFNFNHLDFIFAIDSKRLLYDNVVALLNS
ncbi:hydrolase, partial [Oryctes borbonicus]